MGFAFCTSIFGHYIEEFYSAMSFSSKFLNPKSERTTMSSHYLFFQILETPSEYVFKNNQPVPKTQRTAQTYGRVVGTIKPKEVIGAHRPKATPFSLRHALLSWLVG